MYCFPSLRVKWFLCYIFFLQKKRVIEYRFDVVYKLNVDLSVGGFNFKLILIYLLFFLFDNFHLVSLAMSLSLIYKIFYNLFIHSKMHLKIVKNTAIFH